MMTTKQQQEALNYFRTHAEDWRSKAADLGDSKVNVIGQRNAYILQIAEERPTTRSFLDVGCGTGELVCQMARRGVYSTGVDYAPEMIDLASQKARNEQIPLAKFVCNSVFDFEIHPESYDLISANGFIEYLSQQEMQAFFDLAAQALSIGGSLVVGSRNRLFNLVAMNDFTLQEIISGDIDLLLREAVKWSTAKGMVGVVRAECATLQPPETTHTKTGIDVATRFQYSPFQLINLLQDRGLRPIEVYPVHIHGVTPSFKDANPEAHASIANLLQAHAKHNTQLLAQSSTFMLHVKKEK